MQINMYSRHNDANFGYIVLDLYPEMTPRQVVRDLLTQTIIEVHKAAPYSMLNLSGISSVSDCESYTIQYPFNYLGFVDYKKDIFEKIESFFKTCQNLNFKNLEAYLV